MSDPTSTTPTDHDDEPVHPEFIRGHVAGYEQCKRDHGIPDEPQPETGDDWWACAHNPPCTLLSQCDYNPIHWAARALLVESESPRDVPASAEGTP